MALSPRFGPSGFPIFGVGDLPLICDDAEVCCGEEDTPWNCGGVNCNDGLTPYQALVTLPSVTHTDTAQLNHAGGTFLCDFYGTSALFPTKALGAPIGANGVPQIHDNVGRTSAGSCGYMGAAIGSHCGHSVRPFAAYRFDPGTGIASRYVGYAREVPAGGPFSPSHWLTVPFVLTSGAAGAKLRWIVDSAAADCETGVFTLAYAGETAGARSCTATTGFTYTIGAATVTLEPG